MELGKSQLGADALGAPKAKKNKPAKKKGK
jgi:hypothetical protein